MRPHALYALIGQHVREYRIAAGLSQAQLANACGLTRTSITNIESGVQHSMLDVYMAIAMACGTELYNLMPTVDEYRHQLGA